MGNGIVAQSEEAIAPNDTLPASPPRVQILHVRFRWRCRSLSIKHYTGCVIIDIYKYINKLQF